MANPYDRGARTITLDTVATSSGGSRNYPAYVSMDLEYYCDSTSTTIIPPGDDTVYSRSEDFIGYGYDSTSLEVTYSFGVTNPSCPITQIYEQSDSDAVFTITDHGGGSYTVSLDSDSTRTAGTYEVTVIAYAEMDYSITSDYNYAYATHTFVVTKECTSTEVLGLTKTQTFYIPETSFETHYAYDYASDFVSAPSGWDGWNTCT